MAELHMLIGAAAASALGAFVFGGHRGVGSTVGADAVAASLAVSSAAPIPQRWSPSESTVTATVTQVDSRRLPGDAARRIVERARHEVDAGVRYDATYRLLSGYPNGDIPADRGACTDVVIRGFRAAGVDLQVLVHDDIESDREFYGFGADPNVDHRRTPTLYAYFVRHTLRLSDRPKRDASSFQPGDVVFYNYKRCYSRYPCAPEHVAVVSDRIGPRGLPLVIQNGGPQATESDSLDHGKMVGHFRFPRVIPRSGTADAESP